jgi:translation initiation factor 1 (eIF-1/SUI1)
MGKSRGKIDDETPKSDAFAKKGLKQKIRGAYEKMFNRNPNNRAELVRSVSKKKISPNMKVKTTSRSRDGKEVYRVEKIVTGGPFKKDRTYIKTQFDSDGNVLNTKKSLNPAGIFKKRSS